MTIASLIAGVLYVAVRSAGGHDDACRWLRAVHELPYGLAARSRWAVTSPAHHELAEHVATYAAERCDAELEQMCDDVLAGLTEESLLLAVVSGDPELQEAVERGRNAGWRSRRVQDAFERATVAITGRSYAEVAAETSPPAPLRTFAVADALRTPEFGRLIKSHLEAEAKSIEHWSRWILGDVEYEAMRERIGKPPGGANALLSRSPVIAVPSEARTGIYRMRERLHRIRYNRERRMAIEVDGVSWPVDLGEAG